MFKIALLVLIFWPSSILANECPKWAEIFDECPIAGGFGSKWIEFYNATSEEHLTLVLVHANPSMSSEIVKAIQNRNLYGRRYAIAAIGIRKYEPAIPILDTISRDETEPSWIRFDAGEAIKLISRDSLSNSCLSTIEKYRLKME